MTRIHLSDGQTKTFDAVEKLENGWYRCVVDETSPREALPETTKYYHEDDIERVVR